MPAELGKLAKLFQLFGHPATVTTPGSLAVPIIAQWHGSAGSKSTVNREINNMITKKPMKASSASVLQANVSAIVAELHRLAAVDNVSGGCNNPSEDSGRSLVMLGDNSSQPAPS